jgi:hypothetical protein
MTEKQEFEHFMNELQAIQPSSRRRNNEAFGEAYVEIEQRLAAKVPQKAILAAFNKAYGLKVSPTGFRQLLDAERERRQLSGEMPLCRSCGRPLETDSHQAFMADEVYVEGDEA